MQERHYPMHMAKAYYESLHFIYEFCYPIYGLSNFCKSCLPLGAGIPSALNKVINARFATIFSAFVHFSLLML